MLLPLDPKLVWAPSGTLLHFFTPLCTDQRQRRRRDPTHVALEHAELVIPLRKA